jgi:hypothetical protein
LTIDTGTGDIDRWLETGVLDDIGTLHTFETIVAAFDWAKTQTTDTPTTDGA